MNRIKLGLLAACILIPISPSSVSATKIEIPLPELSGSFAPSFTVPRITREMTLRFDRLPVTIYGVSIRLQGYAQPGYWECDWGSVPIPLPKDIYFTATMSDSVTGGSWRAKSLITCPFDGPWGDSNFPPCEFDAMIAFLPVNGASWDFLKAGRARIALSGEPEPVTKGLSCTDEDPVADLYLATLVIDADYQIGTKPATWGAIKALFPR